jgi:hypothetical protein
MFTAEMQRCRVVEACFVILTLVCFPFAGLAHAQMCPGDCDDSGSVGVNELVVATQLSLTAADPASCTAADVDGNRQIGIDELVAAVGSALNGCPQRQAFVVGTNFPEAAWATIGLDSPRVVDPVSSARLLYNDPVPRVFGDHVYIVNRFLGDSIQALDPSQGFATVWQCSTGSGTNPQDFLVHGDRAYVSALGGPDLLVVNPNPSPDCSDFLIDQIDLSSLADADGIPEMSQMALVNGRLYVELQRLQNFAPALPGAIAVIDTATDELVGSITLSGEDPFALTKGIPVIDGQLVVGEVGEFGVADGGIERVDLDTGTAQGFFIGEGELGGDLNDFVLVSDHLGYAIVAQGPPDFATALVAFDPAAGQVLRTVLPSVQYIADIELDNRGELYVLDRTFEHPGVRVFRARDGVELTSAPLDIGLPPLEVVFLP